VLHLRHEGVGRLRKPDDSAGRYSPNGVFYSAPSRRRAATSKDGRQKRPIIKSFLGSAAILQSILRATNQTNARSLRDKSRALQDCEGCRKALPEVRDHS
jgi:hypothetical protein